jgi:putative hydrolase of the HAD superfamily
MVQAVLFDADGVLQRPAVSWRKAFASILGPCGSGDLEPFLNDIANAESSALCSPAGFVEVLAGVLKRWGRADRVSDAIGVFNAIEPSEEVMLVVEAIQRSGIPCYIASNQQASRAHHMSEVLSYRSRFRQEFYSCYLGVAKPRRAFFECVLGGLGLHPSEVLFVDDREDNVQAAREVGLIGVVFSGESGASVLREVLANHGLELA